MVLRLPQGSITYIACTWARKLLDRDPFKAQVYTFGYMGPLGSRMERLYDLQGLGFRVWGLGFRAASTLLRVTVGLWCSWVILEMSSVK